MSDFKCVLESSSKNVRAYLPYNRTDVWFSYQRAYLGVTTEPLTLVVEDKDGEKGVFRFTDDSSLVSLFGAPTTLVLRPELTTDEKFAARKAFVSWCESYLKGKKLILNGGGWSEKAFFSKIVGRQWLLEGSIDLTLSDEHLWQSVRKSYRSLINWSKENLDLSVVTSSNFSAAAFESFKQLHIEAAGRKTRSDESWDVQAQQIRDSAAFLVVGTKEGRVVTGMFNLFDHTQAFYAVAASDRILMANDLPLAHGPLWYSIHISKRLGLKRFSFGDVSKSESDPKLNDITSFKRGFCTELEPTSVLEIQL